VKVRADRTVDAALQWLTVIGCLTPTEPRPVSGQTSGPAPVHEVSPVSLLSTTRGSSHNSGRATLTQHALGDHDTHIFTLE